MTGPFDPAEWLREAIAAGWGAAMVRQSDGRRGLFISEPARPGAGIGASGFGPWAPLTGRRISAVLDLMEASFS